jgi:hypothetical protein
MPGKPSEEPTNATESMVEVAAQAMWDAEGGDTHLTWDVLSDRTQQHWRRRARTALEAARC